MAALNNLNRKQILIRLLLFASLTTRTACAQRDYEVIHQDETDELGSYLLVIPADEFKKDVLVRIAQEYLHRHEDLKFLYVGVYVDRTSALDSEGKKMFDFSYAIWKARFEAQRRKSPSSLSAAELLKYGKSSSLRIRYADGQIEEVAIEGDHIFHTTINGIALELLHGACVRQGFGIGRKLIPILYFRASRRMSGQEVDTVAQSIWELSSLSTIKLLFRQDQWFIYDSYYPWLNPFCPLGNPPTEIEMLHSQEFLCRPAEEKTCYQSRGKQVSIDRHGAPLTP